MNKGNYIQDIVFNYYGDKMATSSTESIVSIYNKVLIESNELLISEKNINSESCNSFINKNQPQNPSINQKQNQSQAHSPLLNSNNAEDKVYNFSIGSQDSFCSAEDSDQFFFRNKDLNYQFYGASLPQPKNDLNNNNNKFRYKYHWRLEASLSFKAPISRLQWSLPEFDNILACSCYDGSIIILMEEKESNKWIEQKALINDKGIIAEDISFSPQTNRLRLAYVEYKGFLNICEAEDKPNIPKYTQWKSIFSKQVNEYGCTCLCWNPSINDPQTIAIGCKKYCPKNIFDDNKKDTNKENDISNKNNNNICNNNGNDDKIDNSHVIKSLNNLIKIYYWDGMKIQSSKFGDEAKEPQIGLKEGLTIKCSHEDDITDIEWANQNGRQYNMICTTSLDGKMIIWEINLSYYQINERSFDNIKFSYNKMFEYRHYKPLWRCSFNNIGNMISCVDEDGEVIVFLKCGRNQFMKIDVQNEIE